MTHQSWEFGKDISTPRAGHIYYWKYVVVLSYHLHNNIITPNYIVQFTLNFQNESLSLKSTKA